MASRSLAVLSRCFISLGYVARQGGIAESPAKEAHWKLDGWSTHRGVLDEADLHVAIWGFKEAVENILSHARHSRARL